MRQTESAESLRQMAERRRTEADACMATAQRIDANEIAYVSEFSITRGRNAEADEYAKALTAAEVCALLNCPGGSIEPLRKYGVIKVSDKPGPLRVLFDRASVEAVIGRWYECLAEAKVKQAARPKRKAVQVPAPEPLTVAPILTAAEVSASLRCSRAYVTLLLQHKIIIGEKVYVKETGPAWRIDSASVEAVRNTWRGMLSEALAKSKADRAARLSAPKGAAPVRPRADVQQVEPDAQDATIERLALVLRWGITMRQLSQIVAEGWLRTRGNDVIEADADRFESGVGAVSLKSWKRDNASRGYGRAAGVALGKLL